MGVLFVEVSSKQGPKPSNVTDEKSAQPVLAVSSLPIVPQGSPAGIAGASLAAFGDDHAVILTPSHTFIFIWKNEHLNNFLSNRIYKTSVVRYTG